MTGCVDDYMVVCEPTARGRRIYSAKDLIVYQKAYDLAMRIYRVSSNFPSGERYSLTDQVRRACRSTCTNLREAWAKRRYEAHFTSKLTDCDGENAEIDTWLDFAMDCGHISAAEHRELVALQDEVGRMLGAMIQNPAPFIINR